jgi:hypothetical protein
MPDQCLGLDAAGYGGPASPKPINLFWHGSSTVKRAKAPASFNMESTYESERFQTLFRFTHRNP